jgi:substrate import-associated zinc metallohydrolase lipoprotein
MKRNNILTLIAFSLLVNLQYSCRKSDSNLDVDLDDYNSDKYVYGELDNWLEASLTNPYNIEVVYRFDRSMGDIAKNISPPNIDRVKPTAEMVLNGFIKVYEKVAGATFIKTRTPKQFVFFGSTVYNSNGSETLGTADGGRRVILYNLNTLDENDYNNVKRRLRTIHHEFTHILNQTVEIPPTFEKITPSDYTSDWTNSANTEDLAQKLGFISRYARDQYTEDFAETVAHLLVEGQLYYDRYANAAGADGKAKLKQKEAIVVDYFKQYYDIDFRQLQYEMSTALASLYKDPTETLVYQMKQSYLKQIDVDLNEGAHYVSYGQSAVFKTVWSDVEQKLGLNINGSTGRTARNFSCVFNGNMLQIQASYSSSSTSTSITKAFFDFNITYQADGSVKFIYVPNTSSGTEYNNGRITISGWQPLIDYLTNNVFVPDWLPKTAGLANLRKYAGFYVQGNAESYFYGPIVLN